MSIEPVVVVFLERANGHRVGDDFPGYFKYQYNSDPKKLLKKTQKNKLVIKSDYKIAIEKASSSDLKNVLKKHGLKVSGKKQDLIKRLVENFDEKTLKTEFPDAYWTLTEKGKKIVLENNHIIYYHKSQYLTNEIFLEDYHNAVQSEKNDPDAKYNAAIKLLIANLDKNLVQGNWGLYRNTMLSLSKTYQDKQEYETALNYLFKLWRIDLSGLSNNNLYLPSTISIAPGIVGIIKQVLSKLNLDLENMKTEYSESIKGLQLPKSRFSDEESFTYMQKAIQEGIDNTNQEIENIIQ